MISQAELLSLKPVLDLAVQKYNTPGFITKDPISVPHQFKMLQDREIIGFFAATLAWGNRTSILNSCQRLIALMGGEPYHFIRETSSFNSLAIKQFVHRTFNSYDLEVFLTFLAKHYAKYESLELAFWPEDTYSYPNVEQALNHFHEYFFNLVACDPRVQKHLASPAKKSACKRLNMFLRWMVRRDKQGVDFGVWRRFSTSQLICPIDVHVGNVARELGLLERTANDWQAAVELTECLKQFDPQDPVRYDYALFSLGAERPRTKQKAT